MRTGRGLPAAICLPYGAGDVLFAGLASRHVTTPLYRKIMVRDCYRDIWADSGSSMEMMQVSSSEVNYTGNQALEGAMYARQARKVGNDIDHFLAYGRASRIYDRSPFHRSTMRGSHSANRCRPSTT